MPRILVIADDGTARYRAQDTLRSLGHDADDAAAQEAH